MTTLAYAAAVTKRLRLGIAVLLIAQPNPGGCQCEFCRTWRNQREISVKGIHFIQEDAPDEIGAALATFGFENQFGHACALSRKLEDEGVANHLKARGALRSIFAVRILEGALLFGVVRHSAETRCFIVLPELRLEVDPL